MANALQVAKLREGARAWNAWRSESPEVVPDLSELALPVGLRQFGPAQGGPIDLRGADLRRAALEHATLIGAALAGALLAETDLTHARLENADLAGADLRGARLRDADLQGARLDGANLSGANLRGARNLTQAQLERAVGDATTVLPPRLEPPRDWGAEAHSRMTKVAQGSGAGGDQPKGDAHAILGVRRRATAREIRAAYLRLVKELHPDRRVPEAGALDARAADERLKLINEAYQELKGFGGGAEARRAERRSFRRRAGALFMVGALTSAVPVLAVLIAGFYYAGWLGEQTASPPTAASRDGTTVALRDPKTEPASPQPPSPSPSPTPAEAERAPAAPEEVREAARAAAWAEAQRRGTREAMLAFAEAHPDDARAAEARQAAAAIERAEAAQREERTAWATAERSGAKADLQGFIDRYPDGEHAPQARALLAAAVAAEARLAAEIAAWAEAERVGSKAALRRYLAEFPLGKHAAQAQERVALLEAEESEHDDAAWLKAARRDSKTGYAGYLTAFPEGRRAAEARLRISELERAEERPAPEPAKAPGRPRAREPAVAAEPFIGADGRIRR